MQRILVLADYPNLNQLKIVHFRQELVLNYFKNESLFKSSLRRQITNLVLVSDDKNDQIDSLKDYTRSVYGYMLKFFENLKEFTMIKSVVPYPRLSLYDFLPNLFSSSTLTDLCINVANFDDCLCLLDGRLKQLSNLSVNIDSMEKSRIIYKTNNLPNLKCFSLKSFNRLKEFDVIVSLLRRMINLEKLSLYLRVKCHHQPINGAHLIDPLNHMPKLDSFTFYIGSSVETFDFSPKLSNASIQQTLTHIREDCVSNIHYLTDNNAVCHIFSVPFLFDHLEDLGNGFANISFPYVTFLIIADCNSFEHEFFVRIGRSFPLLTYLRIFNMKDQLSNNWNGLSYEKVQSNSTVEYPHLTSLDVRYSSRDYLEQFLNESKAYAPFLTNLATFAFYLKHVTENFTRQETRRNCKKIKQLLTSGFVERSTDFFRYFPSVEM
ncbi:unnamed protein product [Adineta ricciae]|uniref:Uncharacterized protein n=1 Tax=Adineta ricciae TaxID=249248 RepID=A0A815FI68_ADIRI|nr:unnamed protein product [Adineta ricciae]